MRLSFQNKDIPLSESKIRDNLASHLSVINSDYQLVAKEHYLPNNQGTRGFVDILATNEENQHVIIEIKRTNASSREAIHEVLKYIEGIKANTGANDDEIVVVIVSTEWKELLVPFSSFAKRVKFNVIGYHIDVDEDFNIISAMPVTPLALKNDRILSDCHMIYRYLSKSRMQEGIESISSCYEDKGVFDYIILVLTPPEGQVDIERANVRRFMASSGMTEINLEAAMPNYEYMLYTSSMLLSDEVYLSFINEDSDLQEEFDYSYFETLEGTDKTNLLYESAVLGRGPYPKCDFIEIGTPAKFSQTYLDGGWEIKQVIRAGKLKANNLLSDDVLINELKGYTGTNHSFYKKSINNKSIYSFLQIRAEVTNCLQDNPIWRGGINHALSFIEKELQNTEFDGEIYIYHPCNTINTICSILTNFEDHESWIPHYHVSIQTQKKTYYFYGCLSPNGNSSTFEGVITNFYGGDTKRLMMTQTWGGYDPSDYLIAPSFGLQYTNYRVDLCLSTEDKRSFKFDGYTYHSAENVHPYQGIMTFIEDNLEFCHEVVDFYRSRQLGGGMFMF